MFLARLLIVWAALQVAYALDNGLARTPPMGWMHWQRFRCITDCDNYPDECISEALFKRIADRLVADGYAAAGYDYVIIDDCWLEKERDAVTKKLVPDRQRFPSGLKALAEYIHGKGLKFGLYQDYGTHTCAGYPGVIDHMQLDAQTFAEWDVDYVKLDGCYADFKDMDEGYPEFGRYLNQTNRPMVYSCSWPVYQEEQNHLPNFEAIKQHCNLWRNYDDIDDSYASVMKIADYFAKNQDRIVPNAGPGHWNDPDMLILGNYGLSYDQSKTQMAIWAVLAAPLIMSNDLDVVCPKIRSLLLNTDVIAIDQDAMGIQGRMVQMKNNIQVWMRPVLPQQSESCTSYAVAFVSRRDDGAPYTISFPLSELGLNCTAGYTVRDLFEEKEVGAYLAPAIFKTRVNPTGVNFFKFTAN